MRPEGLELERHGPGAPADKLCGGGGVADGVATAVRTPPGADAAGDTGQTEPLTCKYASRSAQRR